VLLLLRTRDVFVKDQDRGVAKEANKAHEKRRQMCQEHEEWIKGPECKTVATSKEEGEFLRMLEKTIELESKQP
jgi:hypothetical protein